MLHPENVALRLLVDPDWMTEEDFFCWTAAPVSEPRYELKSTLKHLIPLLPPPAPSCWAQRSHTGLDGREDESFNNTKSPISQR